MTAVNFSDFILFDDEDAVTIESVYKRYGSYAGVQSFSFDNAVTNFSTSLWGSATGITRGNTITATATNASERLSWYSADTPHSYTAEFTRHQASWGVLLRGNGSNSYYKVSSNNIYLSMVKYEGGVATQTWSRSLVSFEQNTYSRIKIAVRDAQFTSDSPGRIIYISVWENDEAIFSIADNVATNNPPLKMAMVIPISTTVGVLYSDFRIPNLGEVIQWSSLDPREHPMDGITRAVEDRYVKAWMRWDGTLRAWSPTARALTNISVSIREFNLTPVIDTRQIFSTLRVQGAFQWVRMLDPVLVRLVGDKFAEISNTSLWNADDCYRIGLQMFMRAKEQVFQVQINSFGGVFLEVEDRILLPDHTIPDSTLDYIIGGLSWSYENGTFHLDLSGRQYFYGEP